MGGSFEWVTSIVDAANEQSRRERQDALWLDDAKVFGRRQIEVGWGNPFIKGGLLLTGWMILGVSVAIAAAIRSRSASDRFWWELTIGIFAHLIGNLPGSSFGNLKVTQKCNFRWSRK